MNSEEDLVNIQKDTEAFIEEMKETFSDMCARLKKCKKLSVNKVNIKVSNLSGRIDPDIDKSVSTHDITKKQSQENMRFVD